MSEQSFPMEWAYAFEQPELRGKLKQSPEDFLVDEILGFDLTGEGEHCCLHVRKTNTNTEWIARQLARFAGVKNMDVSYAGLKDRQAITTQWFSIYLGPNPEPDWSGLSLDGVEVLEITRHQKKIRRGALKGNRFTLTLRDLQGDLKLLEGRLQKISWHGVPNYFGEQRFGRNGSNLGSAHAMFVEGRKIKDRHKRGLYLSAARSYLFNTVLSERVKRGDWNQALLGDAFMLQGSHSFFVADELDEELILRLKQQDIQPTAPLWGRGELATRIDVEELEKELLQPYQAWCDGLERAGLEQARRGMVSFPGQLEWQLLDENTLQLKFVLPAGEYATSVLRELVQ